MQRIIGWLYRFAAWSLAVAIVLGGIGCQKNRRENEPSQAKGTGGLSGARLDPAA